MKINTITYLPQNKVTCPQCKYLYKVYDLVLVGHVRKINYEYTKLDVHFFCSRCEEWVHYSANLNNIIKDSAIEYIGYNTYVVNVNGSKRLFFEDIQALYDTEFEDYKVVDKYVLLHRIKDDNIVLDLKDRTIRLKYTYIYEGTLVNFLRGQEDYIVVYRGVSSSHNYQRCIYNKEFRKVFEFGPRTQVVFTPYTKARLPYVVRISRNHIYKHSLDTEKITLLAEVDLVDSYQEQSRYINVINYQGCISTSFDVITLEFLPGTEKHVRVYRGEDTYSIGIGIKERDWLDSWCNTFTVYNRETGKSVEVELKTPFKIRDSKLDIDCVEYREKKHLILKMKEWYIVTHDMQVLYPEFDEKYSKKQIIKELVPQILEKIRTQQIVGQHIRV